MNYTKILTLLIVLITNTLSAQNYFEGEVQYKIEYEAINKNIPITYLEQELGKSFTAYVKEDRYAMVYHGQGKQGWMKTIVRLDEGYSYTEFEKSDTITKTKFGSEKNELIMFKRNTNDQKKILGEDCESITINYKTTDTNISEIRGKYYFNPKYRLNPKLYSKYTDSFWNLYVEEAESISLRNETELYPLFKAVQEVTTITEKKIDNATFEPNKSKVILTK